MQFSNGTITTIAGNGTFRATGDGGNAAQAGFDPYGLTLDSAGNLYIADFSNDRVRKVTVATNIITTVAGSGVTGYSGDNGTATSATLDGPTSVAVDSAGNLYICDEYNNAVRKVTAADGKITTFAGTGELAVYGDGGAANKAGLAFPQAVALDPTGTQLYVIALGLIRSVNLGSGVISSIGGSLDIGFRGDGGPVSGAIFANPFDLHVGPNGDLYIADTGNYRVRKVSSSVISTVAGSDVKDNVAATTAYLNAPEAILLASNGDVIVSDTFNHRVRRIGSDGVIRTVGGNGTRGSSSGRIDTPIGLALDAQDNLLFCEAGNDRIRVLAGNGNLATYAGSRTGFAGDGGLGAAALLSAPNDIKFDQAGNSYIADAGNLRVRKVDAKAGIITTIGGNGRSGSAGVGGPATQVPMGPLTVAPDGAGNVYVADFPNNRVLKIEAATGNAVLVAGTGAPGFSGDGGPAIRAQLRGPTCARLDAAGNLYICDLGNAAVRKVTPAGVITTIAGSGQFQFDRDTGTALAAALVPTDIAVSASGQIYVADSVNNRIRKLTPQVATAIAAAAGNNLTGNPGTVLQLSVKVVDAAGLPVGGLLVNFSITSGSGTLAAPSATTAGDGTATVSITLGQTAGPVVVTASAAGLTAVRFNLTVNQVITVPVPHIFTGGIASAGLSAPALTTLAPGGIASIFGDTFAPAGTAAAVTGADLVNGKVPVAFAGVCVEVAGVRSPVYAVYPGQINFQVPSVAFGRATVQVVTGCGTGSEVKSNVEPVTVQAASPEFFYFQKNSSGKNPIAAVDAVTGAYLGALDLFPAGGTTPVTRSTIVSMFGTGFGRTSPALLPGEIPAGIAMLPGKVQLTLGGVAIPAENILYAGILPFNPGVYQINFTLPPDTPDGDLEVIFTIDGVATARGPFLTVKTP